MTTPVLAAIFHPPTGPSPLEKWLGGARRAAAVDLIESFHRHEVSTHVLTPESEAEAFSAAREITLTSADHFHFGEALSQLVRSRQPEGILVFGSGSAPLMDDRGLERLIHFVAQRKPGAVFNNFYSCDFAAIASPSSIVQISLPETDNALGFSLADAGIPCQSMKRSAATQFDVDTPTDLHILKSSGLGGRNLRAFLQGSDDVHPTLNAILPHLATREALVSLIGRMSPQTWSDIEGQVACRTSALIEGRGLRTYGPTHRPLIAEVLREGGPEAFFRKLSDAADAAIIDTRPLLAEEGQLPSASDRFRTDLFRADGIENPRWRAFAEAAACSSIPVLLGGHSLVSGGLYVLAGICWNGRTLERRLHPDIFEPDKEPS